MTTIATRRNRSSGLGRNCRTLRDHVGNEFISLLQENALEPLIDSSFESLVSPLIPCLQPLIIDAM